MDAERGNGRPGRLEVIAGPMFAGKSEELLRRVRRARLAGVEVDLLVHAFDERYASGAVATHTGETLPARPARDVDALRDLSGGSSAPVLALDEAQFFGPDLLPVVQELVAQGRTVLVAGLCVTYDAEPFPPLPELMALADDVLRLTAVCAVCGRDAPLHRRLRGDGGTDAGRSGGAVALTEDAVGGVESYQACCRLHHPRG